MSSQATSPKTIAVPWIRYRSIAYLKGKGLSFGCANDPIYPKAAMDAGKYSINIDTQRHPHLEVCDMNLDIFAKDSVDHVFIGARDQAPIEALCSKLKLGGHIVVQAIETDPQLLRTALSKFGQWQEKDVYQRDGMTLGIWKLLARTNKGILPSKAKPAKRACIARYGAIGDMLMISPLIRKLHEDGYAVTLNITPYCAEVLKNNPYVSNIILQERDAIPNPDLGAYWQEWMNDYDKYINLSESIEGKLLKVEGRRDFYTIKSWREELCGSTNYFDQTFKLAGYPEVIGQRPELFFTKAEEKQAQFVRSKAKDKFLILWAAKGSSYHKSYPLLAPVLSQWLDAHPDAHVFLAGGPQDKPYGFEHPQVTCMFGEVPIRDVFCLTKYVDLVAGPETSITNASAAYDTPKLILLSHSNHTNLCKYFTNHVCLVPEVPCSGCHQLHYTLESCPCVEIKNDKGEAMGTYPVCAALGVTPKRLSDTLDTFYTQWLAAKA